MSRSEIREAAARFANSEENVVREKDEEMMQQESTSNSAASSSMMMRTMDVDDSEFLSMLPTVGSGNFAADFGLFPGFNDFSDEYSGERFREELSPTRDYESYDGSAVHLWNF